ncbi:TRAP transporter large permease [Pseudodesulfovibrio sediminis]|uniref:Transporter n=1 Tax=Pseudodesulfovibrio sediminis TaxID=2810563 RepID=A0ABN6ETB2_9BACT|nr:TRAP transporter large permease [Pseudodesulfovibrio sediminis]BCS89577.1 transporter [Pseudodesulfovibrio sediminis]
MIAVVIAFFGLLIIGVPIGFVLGIAGVLGLYQIGGDQFLVMAPKRFFEGLDLFTFMAMPFFILAGETMNRVGMTKKLADFADALVGYMRGGLAHSNMLASVLFAGMTGAAVSDTAAFGNTLVPAMVKQGYTRPFACAVTAAGSIIGPTIPPSNLMVIYGSLAGVSIAGLFAAGILPGILICVLCMALIVALSRKLNLPKSSDGPSLSVILRSFKGSIIALIMPAIILGGILGGIVTPTEAAAIAVFYAFFVGIVIERTLTFDIVIDMLIKTARITGMVFLIIASASILSWWMTFMQIPQQIADGFLSLSTTPWVIKGMILAMLLAIGMFMDINAALIILTPMLGTLTASIGMNPVHAGVVIVLALNISLMTPPVGACLFVLSSVTGESIEKISASLWPFILVEVGILLLITYFDDLAMFFPNMLLNL